MHVAVLDRLGPVRPKNLALRPILSMRMAVIARFGLYALKTWLYAHELVCMFYLGRPKNLALRPRACVQVPVRAPLGLYAQ